MEYLDLKDWIALVSSLGTFLSSIFVLITLFELRTQRKQSYIPEVIIPDVCFDYSNEYEHITKIWKADDGEGLSLKVHNIGLGVAKDIDFEWKYNMKGMIKIFDKLYSTEKGKLYHDSDDNRLFYHDKDGRMQSGSSLEIDNRHLDFLLPYKEKSDFYNLELPLSYICISTAIYENAKFNEIFDSKKFEESLLPLTLTAKYKDVGGTSITKKFKVEVKFFLRSINLRTIPSDMIVKMRGRVYIEEC